MKTILERAAAEVMGSNHPTQSTFITLVKYGYCFEPVFGYCRTGSTVI